MLKILICTAALGAPIDTETCYIGLSSTSVETYCATARAFALVAPKGRQVTFCKPFDGRVKP